MGKWFQRLAIGFGFILFLGCFALAGGLIFWELPRRLDFRESAVVSYDDGQSAHVFLSEDEKWRIRADLDRIDPVYVDALIRFEDKRFYQHFGVDPVAILRALWLNMSMGRRTSGASTITMQLVRVLEPRPRNVKSKIIEAYRATQLELYLSKEEILEGYLRFAPFGRNIEGVEAASLSYFSHSAKNLSPVEIATLLAVPQNPNRRYPDIKNTKRLEKARNRIADWLLEEGGLIHPSKISNENRKLRASDIHSQVIAAPVPNQLFPFPREIPHLAFSLRGKEPTKVNFPTTLNRGSQLMAERILLAHRESSENHGIKNASVVVVENSTGEIRALIGNFNFGDKDGAQIPGFNINRSTGSLLKPFIVATAIDSGMVLPETLTLDVPTDYGTYSPKNYDENFRGLVSAEDALAMSLNIPFVRMLNELGPDSLTEMMRGLGTSSLIDKPGYYGLSAAVGSIEISPLEIANLYTALTGQIEHEIRFRRDKKPRAYGSAFMSQGSMWLVRKMLRKNDRPGFNRRKMNPNATPIFWKTGTSYGFRDAWAAGSNASYTAVVWMGNFDNTGNAQLLGSKRSGPVLFDLLETLSVGMDQSDPRPEDLGEVRVCAYSGHPSTPACEHTQKVYAPTTRAITKKCPYHLRIDVDKVTGKSLTPSCRVGRDYETKVFLSWPASVRRYLSDRHRFSPKVPGLAEDCVPSIGTPPRITSPLLQTLRLIPGVKASDQEVPLEAESDVAGMKLSWFVDGKFIGSANAEERLWWTPTKGHHEVLVMDDSGQASRRRIKVN